MGNKVRSVRRPANQPGVVVRVRILHLQRDLVPDTALAVHLHEPQVARLRDHRQAVAEALERMDFNPVDVRRHWFRHPLPDNFLLGTQLDDRIP